MTEIVDARRPADQPTLSFVAGFGIEEAEFALRFDALGQNRQPEPSPEPGERRERWSPRSLLESIDLTKDCRS